MPTSARSLASSLPSCGQFLAVDLDVAVVDGLETVDGAAERGLAGTRGADDNNNLALADVQVDVLQDVQLAVMLVHGLQGDERIAGHLSSHKTSKTDGCWPARRIIAAVRQGRGDQVHRGRLCRPRRRADRPRPGRGSGPAGARAAPREGARGGGKRGDGAAARRVDRQGLVGSDPGQLPPALSDGSLDDAEVEVEVRKRRRCRSICPAWARG